MEGECGARDATVEGGRSLDLQHPDLMPCQGEAPSQSIRIASWNIKAAREKGLQAVADAIERLDSDVVILQEVDNGVARTGGVAQLAVLASSLGYALVFAPTILLEGGTYGLGVLSRLPIQSVEEIPLSNRDAAETRKAVAVDLCAGQTKIRVINHHADYVKRAAVGSLSEILSAITPLEGPTVLGGDFNQTPTEAGVAACLRAGMVDILASRDPRPTLGNRRIDYLLSDSDTARHVVWAQVFPTSASDHDLVAIEIDVGAAW